MREILPGLVGAFIGLAGVMIGAWLGNRHQDRRWLREQKLKAATELTTAGTHLYESQLDDADQRSLTPADRVAWQDRLQAGRAQIHLLCRDDTRDAADRFASLVWRTAGAKPQDEGEVVAALRTFTARLRREIH
ncbi:hypothetical protein [Catenuloplanes japonicus]|uniref:hypothetical protein n=1 Tax=Catenuloplanes japonicus TaxID=33876 RepID=UPI00052795D0|nr:hypothetical protein [Catenuloplanes japonicus]